MINEELIKKVKDLSEKKEEIEIELKKIENTLVKNLCPKNKEECEPAFCSFRCTDTCPFIIEWKNLLNT